MPWVAQYDLKVMVDLMDVGDDTKFRHGIGESMSCSFKCFKLAKVSIPGQLAHSMKELDIKYGFLTNYNQTVFVRQVLLSDGMGLEYSPVIYHNETYDASGGKISMRQAFFYIATLAANDWRFALASKLPPSQEQQAWTEIRSDVGMDVGSVRCYFSFHDAYLLK